ncbi:MAG: HAD-IIA family hydrolase [Actinomycetota bacterium]|nr:HAD-IIA family hydrolase [Actinomycetota bacterium]
MSAPIERYDRFVFDLDGTIWRGTTLLPHAAEVLAEIRRRGAPVAFLTNNGSRSGREVAETLRRMGIEAEPRHIVTSGRAARRLLEDRGLGGRSCFVVGGDGLREELEPLGMEFLSEDEGEHAEVVVVTRDEEFTYGRLRAASRAIARGAFFAATNPDPTFPVEDGFWPGGGAIVAAVQAASGGAEPVFAGKPERPMLEEAQAAVGGSDGSTLMVGDRPASDLESARRMGWAGALVLTGVTGDPGRIDPPPDLLLRDLSDLLSE